MELLPEQYYRAEHVEGVGNDSQFITDQLQEINTKQKVNACIAYSDIYEKVGRFEANTRLREYVNKCVLKNSGKVNNLKTL